MGLTKRDGTNYLFEYKKVMDLYTSPISWDTLPPGIPVYVLENREGEVVISACEYAGFNLMYNLDTGGKSLKYKFIRVADCNRCITIDGEEGLNNVFFVLQDAVNRIVKLLTSEEKK